MPKINSRSKGQRGERQVIDLLQPIVDEVWKTNWPATDIPLLQRNTVQSDRGGFDIIGIPTLALEVKNCQTFQLDKWWAQTLKQAKKGQVPVLIYKKNHVPWRVRMMGGVGNGDVWIPCLCDISMPDFMQWFREHLETTL